MKRLVACCLLYLAVFQISSMTKDYLGENLSTLVTTLETLQALLFPISGKPSGIPSTIDTVIIARQLESKPAIAALFPTSKGAISATIAKILISIPEATYQELDSILNTIDDFAAHTISQDDLNDIIRITAPAVSQNLLDQLAKELKGKEKVEEEKEAEGEEEGTQPTQPIAWAQYIPLEESSFAQEKDPKDRISRYSTVTVPQTINFINSALVSTTVSEEQEYSYKSQAAINNAIDSLNALPGKLVQQTNMTDDQARNLMEALYAFLEITPLQNAGNVLHTIVNIIALTNFDQSTSISAEQKNSYRPGKILSFLSNGYLGNRVLSLRQEIDREIRNKNLQQLAESSGIEIQSLGRVPLKPDPRARAAHIHYLARKLAQALNRINLLTNLYLTFKQDKNSNLSLLDQDLFFSTIVCNWNTIQAIFNELKQVLTQEEYKVFADTSIDGLDSAFETATTRSINDYFVPTQNRMKKLIADHNQERPLIDPFDVLVAMYNEIQQGANNPAALKLTRFVMQYVPEETSPQKFDSTTIRKIISLWLVSSYQRFLACNYNHFKTQQQLVTMQNMLNSLAGKVTGTPAIRLQAVAQSLGNYQEAQKNNEELNRILTEIDTNPELASNAQSITKILNTIEKMDLEKKEKEQIKSILEPRRNILEKAQKIAQPLYDLCTRLGCKRGIPSDIQNEIQNKLYAKQEYINPTISGTTLNEEEKKNLQRIILESIIAHFITEIYYGRVECPLCSLQAAFYLAENAIYNYNSFNIYVLEVGTFGIIWDKYQFQNVFSRFFKK